MIPRDVKVQAELVAWRLWWMIKEVGVDHLLVVHITTVDPWTWETLTRQFNNFWSKHLRRRYLGYLFVPEFGERGRLHAHVVFMCRDDIRTGYDFAARDQAKKNARLSRKGANAALLEEFGFWDFGHFDRRGRCWSGTGKQLDFGFGRCMVEPVKLAAGLPRYLGGYLTKGSHYEGPTRHRRRVRCSRNVAAFKVPRVGLGVALWDMKEAAFCKLNGYAGRTELRQKFGKRWAFYLRRQILDSAVTELADVSWIGPDGQTVVVPCSTVVRLAGFTHDGAERHGKCTIQTNLREKVGWFQKDHSSEGFNYRWQLSPAAARREDFLSRHVSEYPHCNGYPDTWARRYEESASLKGADNDLCLAQQEELALASQRPRLAILE